MARHVYIHIPFCLRKCRYCAFASIAGRPVSENEYIGALIAELHCKAAEQSDSPPVETLYLGGGTPSLFSAPGIALLLDAIAKVWGFADNAEISIEANPETVEPAWAEDVLKAGVTRVSLGAQSFSERLLAYLGRIHGAERTLQAYDALRSAGLENVNLDLIYGIPTETRAEVRHDLEQIILLAPEHVSAYMFQHETGTAFENVRPLRDRLLEKFFYAVLEGLSGAGFVQYEISNFAQRGSQCRHNRAYWAYQPYVGLGAGAVDCRQPGRRERNLADPLEYVCRMRQGGSVVAELDVLGEREMEFERNFLGLRTAEGIDAVRMPAGLPAQYYSVQDGRVVLTPQGMLVSDEIFSLL